MTLVHIGRALPQTSDKVKEYLASLDKYELRYLSRRCCGGCEVPLDSHICGAIQWDDKVTACSQEQRIDLRKRCLEEYRPRLNRREAVVVK